MRHALALIFALAAAGSIGAAPLIQPPPRDHPDGPPPPPSGTARIKGRVVDAQTGAPIARVHVRLNWMGRGVPRAPVTTDDSGAFAFVSLPAGALMLMADKPAYLQARYPEAGDTLRTSNRPINLGEAQTIDNVVVPMYQGSAISGRVVDARGDPIEFAQVQALRLPKSGSSKPQPRGFASSNDVGEYRLAHLEPGRYVVLATPPRNTDFASVDPNAATDIVAPEPTPTFYPGVSAIDQAQPIVVERGGTVAGADIMLIDGAAAVVSGTLIDLSGQPITRGGQISIRAIVKDIAQNGFIGGMGASVRPDGSFQIKLTPGDYVLEGTAPPVQLKGSSKPGEPQSGFVRLNVAGDVSGISIPVGPGATISGRVVFDGAASVPSFSGDASGRASVMFMSSDNVSCRSRGTDIEEADWSFTVAGVSGTCIARFNGSIPQWFVKSIRYEDKDLLDDPMTFGLGQQVRGVEVLMVDKRTQLTFHVADEQGAPTRDYVGLLVSVDRRRWTDIGRHVRTIVPPPDPPISAAGSPAPGAAGTNRIFVGGETAGGPVGISAVNRVDRETVSGVPAGEYYAIAVDDLGNDDLRDPAFLEGVVRRAARVTLADGAPASVNLQRVRMDRH